MIKKEPEFSFLLYNDVLLTRINMKISKADMNRLYELKGKSSWKNAWTWVGNDTLRFVNRMVRAGVFYKEESHEGFSSNEYHPTDEFIEWVTRKEFVASV